MKTRVRTTSIEAYHGLSDKARRQADVVRALKAGDKSNREIARELGLEAHQVTGRCDELRKMGLVEFKGKRVCKIGRKTVCIWGLVSGPQKNLSLFPTHEGGFVQGPG